MEKRNYWFSTLQSLLILGGLGWLCHLAISRSVIDLRGIDPLTMMLAIAINAMALASLGERLHATLQAWRLDVPKPQVRRVSFQSIYYLFLLPLGIGMEAARLLKLRKALPGTPISTITFSVLADRAIGLAASVFFGLVIAVFHFFPGYTLPATAALIVLGLVAYAILVRLIDLDQLSLWKSASWSVVAYALTMLSVYLAAIALGIEISPIVMVLGLSFGIVAAIVPFALAGFSFGDAAAAGALTYLGIDPISATIVATLAYFTRLMGAFIGAGYELAGDRATLNPSSQGR